jgi:hypothetical protein
MRPCALLFALLLSPAFGQMLVGAVQKIDKDQIQVKRGDGLVTLRADQNTVVAKGKKANDLSLLAVGDDVRVNYYGEDTLTAVNISARVAFSGVITQAATNHLTIDGKGGSVFVFIQPTTKLGVARDQLKAGKRVHVTGWDSGDGVVEAEKVAIE